MPETELRCELDGQTEQWHKENHTHHAFRPEGGDSSGASSLVSDEQKRSRTRTDADTQSRAAMGALRGDPVLRATLVWKGIITDEDLAHMEQVFRYAILHGRIVEVAKDKVGTISHQELPEPAPEVAYREPHQAEPG